VVEQPGSSDPLLVTAGQGVRPIERSFPTSLALDDLLELDDREACEESFVRHSSFTHQAIQKERHWSASIMMKK
jgi:hypothetical protein